jgi:hypothetical protein
MIYGLGQALFSRCLSSFIKGIALVLLSGQVSKMTKNYVVRQKTEENSLEEK